MSAAPAPPTISGSPPVNARWLGPGRVALALCGVVDVGVDGVELGPVGAPPLGAPLPPLGDEGVPVPDTGGLEGVEGVTGVVVGVVPVAGVVVV